MTEGEFARVLEQLKGQTEYVYYHLMGEPLTHPDLPLFLRMAKEKEFKSVITTNGTLLAKRQREILSAGVHKVSISLHSFEEGSDEAYLRYMSGVCDFADAASGMGVIVVFRLWNRGFDGGRNDTAYEYLRSYFKDGDWIGNTRGMRIRKGLFLEWGDRFTWPDRNAPVQSDTVYCYGMRDHFGILCDGSVVPCCLDSDGVITLGNIFDTDISDILSSKRARDIADGFACRTASEELCRRCAYAQRFS
jgi:radical SAM protein with 4Fe4S-binding SPASM domain